MRMYLSVHVKLLRIYSSQNIAHVLSTWREKSVVISTELPSKSGEIIVAEKISVKLLTSVNSITMRSRFSSGTIREYQSFCHYKSLQNGSIISHCFFISYVIRR